MPIQIGFKLFIPRVFAGIAVTSMVLFICACGGPRSSNNLSSLTIVPEISTVALGQAVQFTVTGFFDDGTKKDMTHVAAWDTSDHNVVIIDSSGLATSVSAGEVTIAATVNQIHVTARLSVGKPALVSLVISPSTPEVSLGDNTKLTAIGSFTDKSTKDLTTAVSWVSSQPGVAQVDPAGLVVSKSIGGALIVATMESVQATTQLTVSAPPLVAILVSSDRPAIPLGSQIQFVANGTFKNGTTQDLTNAVTWTSSPAGILSLTSSGLAVGKSVGTATVTAVRGSVSGGARLTVSQAALASIGIASSNAAMPVGASRQLSATGTFTDGTAQNVTNAVSWTSSVPGVLSVTDSGLAVGKAMGTAVITAAQGSISGGVPLTVSAAELVSIAVASNNAPMPVGTTRQHAAKGKFSDGTAHDITNAVSWTSSPSEVISITASGLASAKAVGTAVVTAAQGSISGSASATVSAAAAVSIGVASVNSAMPVGTTQQLTATATFTDGTTHDITKMVSWRSLSSDIVSVSSQGVATAQAEGTATVSAASETLSGTLRLTVSAPALTSIWISPGSPQIPLGGSSQLAAIGHYTDGNAHYLTQSLTWHLDKPEVASLTAAGVVTGQRVGSTSVQVSSAGLVGTATLIVKPVEEISYFTNAKTDGDTAVRITNPGTAGQNLCAMIYVFAQDQQMTECCGCLISQDALRTLSLNNDLISNPLTGVTPDAGSIVLVSADYASNPTCDATSITPSGTAVAWSTHLQPGQGNSSAVTEDTFTPDILSDAQSANLQVECGFIRELGGSQGICGCGTGK